MTERLTTLFFLILTAFTANCQDSTNFEFWISDLDKAGYSRMTYHITSDSIVVKSGPYDLIYFSKDYEKDKVVFSTKLDSNQQSMFFQLDTSLKNDSLKPQYTNLCIMDGMILHFHFEWADKKIGTTLSNYYLEKMRPFVEYVNSIVPTDYKIGYDKEWCEEGMKDCPDDMILD
ncbi:hypothetical protein SAMN05216474_0755 [Lishizhenia tianjinensis]|uniref:DUF4369 domain-containing protein n=1 Tax=Lishizhenia tianjinensis TaxID=477690 RepID=A0A1I6YA11_9FLAO|nr:hypothetical protein [Lishizhenia tianjinensis]SFT47355.1 hypothetical protein SAMN05216474_0755 [Lishizhenia tianjinensis]